LRKKPFGEKFDGQKKRDVEPDFPKGQNQWWGESQGESSGLGRFKKSGNSRKFKLPRKKDPSQGSPEEWEGKGKVQRIRVAFARNIKTFV